MEEWCARGLMVIEGLPRGTVFEVKELYKDIYWKRLSKGERISFGRYFANEVREGRIPDINALERGKDNHSRYVKR